MNVFLAKIRDITISGILALLPLYVFLIVISKIWKSLNSIGAGIAQMLGMKSILGVAGATVFSGLLTIAIWLVTGLLVRYSFLGAVSKAAERQLSKYIPDYDNYKAKAEEKLQRKVRALPYTSALIDGRTTGNQPTSSNKIKKETVCYFSLKFRKPLEGMFLLPDMTK